MARGLSRRSTNLERFTSLERSESLEGPQVERSTRMSVNFDIWDDFADLSTIVQNDQNITYKIKKRENAQVVNNRYIIG